MIGIQQITLGLQMLPDRPDTDFVKTRLEVADRVLDEGKVENQVVEQGSRGQHQGQQLPDSEHAEIAPLAVGHRHRRQVRFQERVHCRFDAGLGQQRLRLLGHDRSTGHRRLPPSSNVAPEADSHRNRRLSSAPGRRPARRAMPVCLGPLTPVFLRDAKPPPAETRLRDECR
jgi:hypothetical protein